MTLLALVRHGETDWNRRGLIQGTTDVPLNETGLAQAADAAARLGSDSFAQGWSGVITSPLSRARVTGEVIASTLGIPFLSPVPGLAERDYGQGEGMEMDVAKLRYPDGVYPESEGNDLVLERALLSIDGIRSRHGGRPLIVVAHGGLLHTLLSRLNGARVPSIANATVNLVEFEADRERWVIHAINGEPYVVEGPAMVEGAAKR